MIELAALEDSLVLGALLVLLVLGFLRFGDGIADRLLLYRSSPVEAVEESMPDRD